MLFKMLLISLVIIAVTGLSIQGAFANDVISFDESEKIDDRHFYLLGDIQRSGGNGLQNGNPETERKCRPGEGWYYLQTIFGTIDECRECNCGSLGTQKFNCTFHPSIIFDGKNCTCPENYEQDGGQCILIPDPCEPKPCVNGGICVRDKAEHKCFCPVGFTGLKCEKRIDDLCQTDSCLNGGTCVQRKDAYPSYACECPKGYAGVVCEKVAPARNICDPNPCLNNAICGKINGSDYTCFCHPNYRGLNCRTGENYTCDFEQGFGGLFANFADRNKTGTIKFYNEVHNWTVQQGRDMDEPFADHSLGSLDGHFAYIELQSGNHSVFGALSGPWLYSDYCITFWYHANLPSNNSDPSQSLNACAAGPEYQFDDNQKNGVLISSTLGEWKFANFSGTLNGTHKAFRANFGVLWWKLPEAGHVAIDDVQMFRGDCSPHPRPEGACTSNPCMNGGTCHERHQGFVCECPKWYTGEICTEDEWCVDGPGKELCPEGACAFDHENEVGYCKWREEI